MDLSTLSVSTPVREKSSEDTSYFNQDELPWRPNEIEAFRKFLMEAKKRSGRRRRSDMKNLCIIKGQTGSGKVTTVKRLCREMNIKIVEFDQFNTVLNKEQEYENSIDHLIRFLQSSLSRSSLKSSRSKPIINEAVSFGNRSLKRIRSSNDEDTNSTPTRYNTRIYEDGEETQLVLVYDLPRVLLNCKFASLYPIQNILSDVLTSDKLYPLVIVTLDNKEDNTIIRRLLSSSYTRDPRCLVINLKEITKSKIFSILKIKKSTLINHIIDISSGDIRYILNNLKFYNINSEFSSESIYNYMLERNNLNNFNLLGRILFNKRIPISTITSNISATSSSSVGNMSNIGMGNTDSNAHSIRVGSTDNIGTRGNIGCNKDSGSSGGITTKNNSKVRGTEVKASDNTPTSSSYSDIRNIGTSQWFNPSNSSTQSNDSSIMNSPTMNSGSSYSNTGDKEYTRYLKFNRCFKLCRPVSNKVGSEKEEAKVVYSSVSSQDKTLSTQERLKRSVDKVPLSIKIDGITEEFDVKRPLAYTKWPKLIAEENTTHFRHNSSRMLPKLTRPLLGYNPEELIDTIKSDPNYFSNCLFDNYSDLYGSLDDCSALTRHFASADVFYSSNRYNQDQEAVRHFLSICIRAASDSNIHGFDVNRRGFHHFIPHSNYKVKIDHIKGLIHEFKLEMSRNDVVSYTHEALLLEIIPILSMVTAEEEAMTEVCSQTQSQTLTTDDDYNILDVMEQVEMMMEKGETHQNLEEKKIKESNIFTTKLNEIVQEISKYYVTKGSQ